MSDQETLRLNSDFSEYSDGPSKLFVLNFEFNFNWHEVITQRVYSTIFPSIQKYTSKTLKNNNMFSTLYLFLG